MGGGIDTDDFDFLGSFIDRLAKRCKLPGRNDDRRRIRGHGLFKNADLAGDIGFGLCAELSNVHAEILTSLARASQHRLPVGQCRVFHDDRNRRLRLRRGRRGRCGESNARHNTGSYQKSRHDCPLMVEGLRSSRNVRFQRASQLVAASVWSIVASTFLPWTKETLLMPSMERSFSAGTAIGPGAAAAPGAGCGKPIDSAVWNDMLPSTFCMT